MALQGATVTVAAGAVTATVTGAFASAYQVGVTPGWITDVQVSAKTATSFLLTFAVPVPPGGSTFDWIVSAPAVSTSEAISGASATVAAAATSLVVTFAANAPSSYQVMVSPSWVTGYRITAKTTTGFTIEFAVPCPPGGGTLDYTIFGPAVGTISLTDYLDELRRLLHDWNDHYWSAADKGFYIGRAMQRRDLDTAINRELITFTLTAGTATYTFSQIGQGQVFDVIGIVLIEGNRRRILSNLAYTDLVIYTRESTTFQSFPGAFSRRGPNQVIFGPTPSRAFSTEWDCCVYASPLVNLTDTDPMPYPYTQPVPFYAAYLAKINERQDDEATEFLGRYQELVGLATNSRMGRIANAYSGLRAV